MYAVYGPLPNFGSYSRDCARAKADGFRKVLFPDQRPDQRIETRLREAGDQFHFGADPYAIGYSSLLYTIMAESDREISIELSSRSMKRRDHADVLTNHSQPLLVGQNAAVFPLIGHDRWWFSRSVSALSSLSSFCRTRFRMPA